MEHAICCIWLFQSLQVPFWIAFLSAWVFCLPHLFLFPMPFKFHHVSETWILIGITHTFSLPFFSMHLNMMKIKGQWLASVVETGNLVIEEGCAALVYFWFQFSSRITHIISPWTLWTVIFYSSCLFSLFFGHFSIESVPDPLILFQFQIQHYAPTSLKLSTPVLKSVIYCHHCKHSDLFHFLGWLSCHKLPSCHGVKYKMQLREGPCFI